MRRLLISVLLIVILNLANVSAGLSFQNEPPGFRGIPWGTHIKDMTDKNRTVKITLDNPEGYEMEGGGINLVFLRNNEDFSDYSRENDRLVFGDAVVESVTYSFYKNRFFRVLIKYHDMWNYEAIKRRLFFVYGPGEERPDRHKTWWWFGKDVSIGLQYSIYSRGGTVSYVYSPIQKDREENHKKMAKEGAEDF